MSQGMSMPLARLIVIHLRIPPARAACARVITTDSAPSRPERLRHTKNM